jgi:hypothetical protein
MSHAKSQWGIRPSGVSTDPGSLCANLRAVDERLRMACEAQYMIPAATISADDDLSQMINF